MRLKLNAAGVHNGLVATRWMQRRPPAPHGLSRKLSTATSFPALVRATVETSPVRKTSCAPSRLALRGGGMACGVTGARNFSLWPFGRSTNPAAEESSQAAPASTAPSEAPATASAKPDDAQATATPATDTTNAPAPAMESVATSTTPPLDALSTPAVDGTNEALVDVSQIPETMGYLSKLGLDFGYGPSSLVQWAMESVHVYTGLPWVASIVALAVGVRILMLPAVIASADTGARISHVKPRLEEAKQKRIQGTQKQDQRLIWLAKTEIQSIYRENGIKPWKSFLPMIQLPIGIGTYRVVDGMSNLGIPSLQQEQFLWITDVTAADPYYVLPLVASLTLYLSLKRGGETATAAYNNPVGRVAMILLPMGSAAFMGFLPSMLQLAFCMTSAFSLGQAYILNNPSFRQWAKITPMAPPETTQQGGQKGPRFRLYNPRLQQQQRRQQLQQDHQSGLASVHTPVTFSQRLRKSLENLTSGVRPSDVQKQLSTFVGRDKEKLGDGTTPPKPRLSEKQLARARDVESKSRAWDLRGREARNEAARREWQQKRAQNQKKKKEYRF